MKHIKISLAVVALILGTGAAFATKSHSNEALCNTPNPKISGECPGRDLQPCCETVLGDQIYFEQQ